MRRKVDLDPEEELRFMKSLQDSWLFKLTGTESEPRIDLKIIFWCLVAAAAALLVLTKLF